MRIIRAVAELSDNGDTARALEEFGAIVIVDELDSGIELMNCLALNTLNCL